MIKKLRENKGAFAIGAAVILLLFCMILSIFISFFPLYTHKQELNTAATEIARYIEIKGAVNSDVDNYVDTIKDTLNLNFDLDVEADYTGASQSIQLESKFEVTLTYNTKFGIGGIVSIPMSIRSKAYGVSEKYRK